MDVNQRIVVLGNSGSGKTSLARGIAEASRCQHLDLDEIAWAEANPPKRADLASSCAAIDRFTSEHSRWVIEGCYASLIEHAAQRADTLYFLNIGIDACVENCRSRPWEPDKYPSREAQDKNLAALIEWVKTYETRDDEFSVREHRRVFEAFPGERIEIRSNAETARVVHERH